MLRNLDVIRCCILARIQCVCVYTIEMCINCVLLNIIIPDKSKRTLIYILIYIYIDDKSSVRFREASKFV